jgi:hypothetical protein
MEEWVRRFGASLPMRMTASWFGSLDLPNTRLWRDWTAPESELPSDRHPDRTKRAIVLEAVKVWPGKAGACRKVGTTANLDSSCARWRERSHGRDEETDFQIEQRN